MGVARMWRVAVGGRRVAFLGPFAVELGERATPAGVGYPADRAAALRAAAAAAGETHVLLVGDEKAYFGRVGFAARRYWARAAIKAVSGRPEPGAGARTAR